MVSELISYADEKLAITTGKATATPKEVFMQAKTRGGITAKKAISIRSGDIVNES